MNSNEGKSKLIYLCLTLRDNYSFDPNRLRTISLIYIMLEEYFFSHSHGYLICDQVELYWFSKLF